MSINCYGKYARIRSCLDYSWHQQYTEERQLQQDRWIDEYLNGFQSAPKSPLLLYTAGAMGAGKSHSLKKLSPDMKNTLLIDPDKFKEMIPEYQDLKRTDPMNAGTIVHKESGILCEIILEEALNRSLNIVVDGSMINYEWHIDQFKRIRSVYPQYMTIEIMFVRAEWDIILSRAIQRGEVTGRKIKEEKLRITFEGIPKSIEILKNHANRVYYVDNNDTPRIDRIVFRGIN